MFDISTWLSGLGVLLALVTITWAVGLVKHDVSVIDSVWGLLFIAAAVTYRLSNDAPGGARTALVLALVAAWGVRLTSHITWRNWGRGEDSRYAAMRDRRGPSFRLTSLATVFWLQAILAWIVSLPLLGALLGDQDLHWLDVLGCGVWLVGFVFEAGGDLQLARFRADPANRGRVMDHGLWRYTRHPNYFGDFAQWWGLYVIAVAAGAWWSVAGPIVMSGLLLRISGVTLLERGLTSSKPGYADYVERTSAFFPRPPST